MYAGCDLGSVTARVVIIEDDSIVSSETMPYKKLPVQAAVEAFEKALSKADLSLRLVVSLRNRAVQAYENLMRMQV